MKRKKIKFLLIALLISFSINETGAQVRLKDIGCVRGMESRRITGYGLVTGLNGTGDGIFALFTIRSLANLLRNMDITVDEGRLRMRNIAGVMVSAELPPFTTRGTTIDAIVSSIGDARSLEGGTLIQSPLYDAKGELLAYAQGPISIGGLNVAGAGGPARRNYALVGKIVNGVKAEKELLLNYIDNGSIVFKLNQPDFTSSYRVSEKINGYFEESIASSVNAADINVLIPQTYVDGNKVIEFISMIEQINIEPDVAAKVVLNERTGTVVIGKNVRILPVAISHGDITIQIRPSAPEPGQPLPAPELGQVVVLSDREGSNIGNLAEALNALKVPPKDIISIFQALKESGALKAELIIM
jgi:flagellar P-ring protein precursor FlgI